eukprot:8082950-Alexandrium_andersonii.AAC.1
MSASLVGSEMCIRDRSSRAAIASRIAVLQLASESNPKWAFPDLRVECDGCLLYTSDAADDM